MVFGCWKIRLGVGIECIRLGGVAVGLVALST